MRPWLLYLGELRVPNYFFMLMLGAALSSGLLVREARRQGLSERKVLDLAMMMVPIALVGARLFHVIFERPEAYLADPLMIFQFAGGLVYYGGFIAVWPLGWWWARREGVSVWTLGDIFCPATAFALVYGRLGCLGAGCGYGRPADWPFGEVVPWAVRHYRRGLLPEELLGVPLHPATLYEALGCLAIFVWLSRIRTRQRFDGQVALAFIGGYGVLRIFVEYFRADAERGVYLGGLLSTSQGISLVFLAVIPFVWWSLSRAGEPARG